MERPFSSLLAFVAPYRSRAALGFLCVAGYIALSLAGPEVLKRAIDRLQAGSLDARRFALELVLFFGLAALAFGISIAMRRLMLGLGARVEHDVRRAVFAHLTELEPGWFQTERTGDLMTRMTSDLSAVREMIGQGLLQGSRIALGFPLAFGVMLALDVRMTLAVGLLLPFVAGSFFFLFRLIHRHYERAQEQFSAIADFAQETFAGIRTLKGFALEGIRRDGFRALNEEYIRRNMVLTRIEEPVWPFMMFLYWVAAVLLLLTSGRGVIDGTQTLGTYVQFQQYLIFLQWPVLALGWTANIFQRGRTSWARLRTVLGRAPSIQSPDAPAQSEPAGDLVFHGVKLELGGRCVLDVPHLCIPEGQTVGLTGPTGSGKTLLASLLPRLLDPTHGEVTLGGIPLRQHDLAALRRAIGVAPQEPFLFSDTLAHNLAFGLDPVEDALATHEGRIVEAARVAQLAGEVERFPDRYGTMLGERGVTLSGGQRQRTAIGRALARDPRLLVLDDVFSAVDTQTEARILGGLLPALRGRTALLISHRVSTLRHADRILVLDGGRIVQDGTHAALAAQPGYYRELDEVQRLAARLEEGGRDGVG